MNKVASFLLAVLAAALPGAVLAECPTPDWEMPRQSVVDDKQVLIAWKPVKGATAYRVHVLSRVPNGRIVASHDTVVASPSFFSPQPLAEDRAKVTARISAVCGAETSAESVFAFTIDTMPTCTLGELSAETTGTKANVKWPMVKGAASYEVRVFSLDGAFISAQETRVPAAQVELKKPDRLHRSSA